MIFFWHTLIRQKDRYALLNKCPILQGRIGTLQLMIGKKKNPLFLKCQDCNQ